MPQAKTPADAGLNNNIPIKRFGGNDVRYFRDIGGL
jgi:hypothetical protein